jgi:hypothetical protein
VFGVCFFDADADAKKVGTSFERTGRMACMQVKMIPMLVSTEETIQIIAP